MNTTVKHLTETRVLVTITLGKPELEAAEQVALKKLAKTTKVAGFRKGHVPLEMVAKHVDPNELGQETLENALSRAVAESFIENKLQALERPEVEVKKFVPGEELEFTAEGDVLPEVTLGDYKNLTVEKKTATVKKADIDEVIERIQKGFGEKKESNGPAKMGDETIIDFVGKKDDVAFDGGTATDYALTLGSNSFIPGFEEAIVGHKAGDTFDVPLTFPAEYQSKDLAGQDVVFTVTIKKVNQVVLPEVDDVFAAKVGPFTSVDDLKKDIKAEITAQKSAKLPMS
jgi:trigger factor